MTAAPRPAPAGALVIGYGSRLRSDDALGPEVAEALSRRRLDGVRTLAVHQLLPELCEAIADAERVVFVDARVGGGHDDGTRIAIEPVRGGAVALSLLGHAASPAGLCALTAALYHRTPTCWLVSATVPCLDLGAEMTPAGVTATDEVAMVVRCLLEATSHARVEPGAA